MLRVLCLYLKVAIFQPELREHAPHTTSVLKSCDLPAGAAGARSAYYVCTEKLRFASRSCRSTLRVLRLSSKAAIFLPELPRTRLRKQARKPRDNFQRPFREQENRTAPQRERFDTHDLRRGFIGLKTDAHGATARAIRHARSPQRARRDQDKFARRHSERASTRRISAEGSPRSRQIRTAPQRERFDTQDLRRGFAATKTDSRGATARALRHARSPQRVRRAQDKFARRHSESASTRTISAEGSPRSRQIRTAPQRERFDTHDLRRGFAALKKNSHGAAARALRHARSPQRVYRAQDKFARGHSESASTRTISAEGCVS